MMLTKGNEENNVVPVPDRRGLCRKDRSSIGLEGLIIQDGLLRGEDPKLAELVSMQLSKIDRDGDGRVTGDELALAMMETVKDALNAKKKYRNLKFIIVALAGLLVVVAATSLATAYVAAKLAQETKVLPDGTLVKANGEFRVKTSLQGLAITLSEPTSRRLQEADMDVTCITPDQVSGLYNESFASPATVIFNDGTTHGIQSRLWEEHDTNITITTTNDDVYYIVDDESCGFLELETVHRELKGTKGVHGLKSAEGVRKLNGASARGMRLRRFLSPGRGRGKGY